MCLVAWAGPAAATTTPADIPDEVTAKGASGAARDLVRRADEALNGLRFSEYSFDGEWNDEAGVYRVVCNQYVNRLLMDAVPEAYDAIARRAGKKRLATWDYHAFFRRISKGETRAGWRRLARVDELRPGDVILWRYTSENATSYGHLSIAASVPRRDNRWSRAWIVRVTDATRSGHSNDNRDKRGGVGAGELLLRADTRGAPTRMAWSLRGYWRYDVSIYLARPATPSPSDDEDGGSEPDDDGLPLPPPP